MFRQIEQIDETIFQKIALYLYKVSGIEPGKIDDIMETISPQAKDAFSQAADELRQWGYNKGISQTAIKMIKKGYSDEQIAEITDIDVKRLQELRSELSH